MCDHFSRVLRTGFSSPCWLTSSLPSEPSHQVLLFTCSYFLLMWTVIKYMSLALCCLDLKILIRQPYIYEGNDWTQLFPKIQQIWKLFHRVFYFWQICENVWAHTLFHQVPRMTQLPTTAVVYGRKQHGWCPQLVRWLHFHECVCVHMSLTLATSYKTEILNSQSMNVPSG